MPSRMTSLIYDWRKSYVTSWVMTLRSADEKLYFVQKFLPKTDILVYYLSQSVQKKQLRCGLKCRSRVRLTPKLATLLFTLAYCTLLEQKRKQKHCYCSKTGDILGVLSRRHRQFFTNKISKILRSWRYLWNPANQVETFKIYQNRTKKL